MVRVSEAVKRQVILSCKVIVRVSAVSSCWWNISSAEVVKYSVYWVVMHALEGKRHSHFSLEICLCLEVHVIFLFINLGSKNLMKKSSACPNPWLLDTICFLELSGTTLHPLNTWLAGYQRESSSFCFEAIACGISLSIYIGSSSFIKSVLVLIKREFPHLIYWNTA